MGNWFGKGKRGLIMGVWNVYMLVGNMFGSILVVFVFWNLNWGMSFIIFGVLMMVTGMLVWNFFVVVSEDVGLFLVNVLMLLFLVIVLDEFDEEFMVWCRLIEGGFL